MIKDLWDLDTAGSTLIAALNQLWNFNPLDYCLHALGAQMKLLKNDSFEWKLIKQYVKNTWTNRQTIGFNKEYVWSIFKVTRKDDLNF